jgi:hypothetical protein
MHAFFISTRMFDCGMSVGAGRPVHLAGLWTPTPTLDALTILGGRERRDLKFYGALRTIVIGDRPQSAALICWCCHVF